MGVRSLLIAAVLAAAVPVAGHAADMAGYGPVAPNCGGLQPVDVYVPPQTAYIVACTVALPEPGVVYRQAKQAHIHEHLAKFFHHGHKSPGYGHAAGGGLVAEIDWRYGNPATHEGKLVYLKDWSASRPPVHMLIVPR